ncbi:MAG: TonB-dependent receptor, partial [Bacteroidales bacterium]|nr:TonB-dependent receptor [Bacteroidales bacterium]
AQNMQVDLGRFSADGLGMLSLYDGQQSQRLQSARAYAAGAVVHLHSERPRHPDGSGGKLRLRTGSFGTANPSVQWDKELWHGVVLRSSAEFLYSNGRYKYPFFDTTLVRENGDIRSLRLEAQLFGTLRRGAWNLHAYSYGSERGYPGPVIRRATGFPFSAERQDDQDLFLQGGWEQDWGEHYATALRFKYTHAKSHYNTHAERNPMAMPYNVHYRQHAGYLSLAQSFAITEIWSADISTDGQFNSLDCDAGQFVTPRRATFTGALATRLYWAHFRAAAHVAYLGAWDYFDTPAAGGWTRENRYRPAWMPSLVLSWEPFSWLSLDAYCKRSERLPSFNDLYYTLMGNAALSPETAWQAGADLRACFRQGAWHGDARLSAYRNRVSQKIVAIPTASQFRWTMLNIGLVDITGLDAKVETGYRQPDWHAGVTARFSFQQALDHSTPGSSTYGNQIPYIPRFSGSLHGEAAYRAWTLDYDLGFSGGKWSRSANTPDYYIRPWCLSDLTLSRRIALPAGKGRTQIPQLHIALQGNNLFNTPYEVVQGYPMPGFNALLCLTFTW